MYGIGDDFYDRMDHTKPVVRNDREPFIGAGKRRLAVLSLVQYQHKDHGPTVRATFVVLVSDNPEQPVGSTVGKLWFVTKQPDKGWKTSDADRFAEFIRRIKGAPDDYKVGRDIATLLRDRAKEQLMRGMVIDAFGKNVSKNAAKPYIDVEWFPVKQTPEEIRDMRAKLDSMERAAPAQTAPQQQPEQAPPQQQAAPAQPSILAQLPANKPDDSGFPW